MAIAYFNGAEPSDVDAFEAMRGAGAFAESVVLARIRHARDEGDVWIRDDAAVLAAVRAGDVLRVDGVVATRGGGTRGADGAARVSNALGGDRCGNDDAGEWPKYEWELQWRAIDLERLSDARRVEPWCFCLGGHDGFAAHVDDETAKFHNYTVRSAGMIFTPDAHQLTTPRSRLIHGRRTNVRNVELGKKYPARDAFRFSSSSPDEAVAILAEVMRAATPQVMTKAQT
jgi:hypothetical protein